MIYSMTGFGDTEHTFDNTSYRIEIRTLNSKGLDINLRMPTFLRNKEIELRTIISDQLKRGKIDAFFNIDLQTENNVAVINEDAFSSYAKQLKQLAKHNDIDDDSILSVILSLPNIYETEDSEIDEQLWNSIQQGVLETTELVNNYRLEEGKGLEFVLTNSIEEIERNLNQITTYEEERIKRIRERILANYDQLKEQVSLDKNRLEQELFFYIEKLDISEEKVRLASHITFFLEHLESTEDVLKGKKLNFIAQEMGREINTIGSKANHAQIQKLVVEMKNSLEQIKEQLANVM